MMAEDIPPFFIVEITIAYFPQQCKSGIWEFYRATRKTTRPAGQGGAHRRKVNEKMAKDKYYGKTLRKNFARHEEVMPMPNLLEIQKKSYQEFLDTGLREVFNDVGAITDYQGNLELTFIDYKMDEAPKYDVEECKARDATYAAPLKVKVRR